MADMLTAKDMQELLQVDRSTIYRMAEAGQLPAIKVGKQWRFPGDTVEQWLKSQTGGTAAPAPVEPSTGSPGDLATILPLDCVQLIQDAFAEVLGVMLVVTDMAGRPLTQVSNCLPVYRLLAEADNAALCQEHWQQLGQVPALEPRFAAGPGGLLCARALVRAGNELKGMVIAFGLAPQHWPPPPEQVAGLARKLGVTPADLDTVFVSVFTATPDDQKHILVTLQRIADIITHIGSHYFSLLGRLESIARLSTI